MNRDRNNNKLHVKHLHSLEPTSILSAGIRKSLSNPSSNAAIESLLVGEQWVGYNPLEAGQFLLTVALPIIFFVVGSFLHSKFSWKRE